MRLSPRRRRSPRACATDLDIGAIWDGSEDQGGERGILTLLAGGSASGETKKLLAAGIEQVVARLGFFGIGRARLIAWRSVSWEDDPWARGAYAFFDPSFPPPARRLLALPFGRIFFAGEHTSIKWQSYMNGPVESGARAANEILVSMDSSRYISNTRRGFGSKWTGRRIGPENKMAARRRPFVARYISEVVIYWRPNRVLAKKDKPIRPAPSRSNVDGSGTRGVSLPCGFVLSQSVTLLIHWKWV